MVAPAFTQIAGDGVRSVEDCCWEKRMHFWTYRNQPKHSLGWFLYGCFSTRVLHTRTEAHTCKKRVQLTHALIINQTLNILFYDPAV